MPIYSYHCHECGQHFEDFRNIKQKQETGKCLSCGSTNIERVENLTASCDCGCGCGGPADEGVECEG